MNTDTKQPFKKTFYVMRHGETDYNRMGIVQGRGVNTDLNEVGINQANLFYNKYKEVPFDKVYTSQLKRTHQTIAPFVKSGITWEQNAGFDELDFGINEGKSHKDPLIETFPSLINAWANGDYNAHFTNGESPLEVSQRQQEAINYVLSQNDTNVLICMHGRAIRIFMCTLLGVELKYMDTFEHANTSLYILGYTGDKFELVLSNSTEHLK